MISFLQILIAILIMIISYLLIEILIDKKIVEMIKARFELQNGKHIDEMLKYYDKTKKIRLKSKINIINKINIMMNKACIKQNLLINSYTIIVFSIASFVLGYYLAYDFFEIYILSIIIAIPLIYLPFALINMIRDFKDKKIEKSFLNFLLQLKNYTNINNDIIYAFEMVKVDSPLKNYIDFFLIEIKSGIKFEDAICHLKDKLSEKTFKRFLENIEQCYLYGGSFTSLIDKNVNFICDIQKEKSARIQETKSARLVLYVLIVFNVFVYITNIKNNHDNYMIMKKSMLGNIILYWNFISIWMLILFGNRLKKLDY